MGIRGTAVAVIVAVGVVVSGLLSGCTAANLFLTGPLATGSCLAKSDGLHADLGSVVSCDAPHTYEVLAMETWPGMDDALDGSEPASVLRELNGGGTDQGDAYLEWSQEFCSTTARAAVGWAGVDLGIEDDAGSPLDSDLIDALPGGAFQLDASLAAETAFAGGDHRTVCSAVWVNEDGARRPVTPPDGFGFTDLLDAEMPAEFWQCVEPMEGDGTPCTAAGSLEITASFDVVAAVGEGLVIEYATTEDEDVWNADLERLGEVCVALTTNLPHREGAEGVYAAVIWDGEWARVYGTGGLKDGATYYAQCYGA